MTLPEHCELCPRRCGANRRAGQVGVCGAGDQLAIARAALHEWEEPPISVGAGSGAVFFSNCPLRCVYCQNSEIACGAHGTVVAPDRLAQIFFELKVQGAANINLVTPTHYLPFVVASIDQVREQGFDLPFVCNTSGYETVETVRELAGRANVYLTDFKYWRDGESDAARRYSHAPDYFDVASAALRAMVETAGTPRFDSWCFEGANAAKGENALKGQNAAKGAGAVDETDLSTTADSPAEPEERLIGGVVVRHLILPGRLNDSKRIMQYLWSEYGNDVLYSVMNQYTPLHTFPEAPELDARVPDEEYDCLLDYLDNLGMTDYFWQEGGAAEESFIPAFDSTGV